MSFKNSKSILSIFAVLLLAIPTIASAGNPKLRVTVGQSITERFGNQVKTVSIANSEVADVVVAGPREILLNGKSIGLTTLVVWDESNVSKMFDVVVRGPFSDQKIELRVKVAEVNRTAMTEIGFDYYGSADISGNTLDGALFGGPTATPQIPLAIFNGQGVEGLTSAIRYITGTDQVQVMIKAAMTNGYLRVLAEPTVIASSGEKASFLAGGEIPVPIASSGSQGGTTITVDWKEYGVKIDFLPTIVDSGVVNLYVEAEVSSLDFNNAIRISGFDIPALRTRKAHTTIELRDREILVIGGLLMEEETEVITRVPLLGHIPILGMLFSNTARAKTETELMLVISPHIVRALPPGTDVNLPTNRKEETK